MTYQKLEQRVQELEQVVSALRDQAAALQRHVQQNTEFQENFSGKMIINKEVQFMQKVRRADGTIVTEINP